MIIERQNQRILQTLKGLLRSQNLTQLQIAERLGVGTATIKRWFSGRGLTLDRLEDLCALARVTLSDLIELAQDEDGGSAARLTLAQERGLAADGALAFLFFAVINGWPPSEFAQDFGVAPEVMQEYLEQLSRLGLARLLPGGQVRMLARRRIGWRRGGPLARHFEARVKRLFLDIDFGAADTHYLSDIAKLSERGMQRLDELMQGFRRDFQEIAEDDRRMGSRDRRWVAMLVVTRGLDLANLAFETSTSSRK